MKRKVTFSYHKSNNTILIKAMGCPDVDYYVASVLNTNMKAWNPMMGCYAILPEALSEVAANVAVSPNVGFIDYVDLPRAYQVVIKAMMGKFGRETYEEKANGEAPKKSTAHETLHVTTSAPIEVVKAAHKALAKKYHPDMENGDEAKFRAVQEAYEKITA